MIQVERNRAATIDYAFTNPAAVSADGLVTVTVTKADGTAIATNAATALQGVGVYRYVLVPQAQLNILTLTYTGTWGGYVQSESTTVEIVGDFYITEAALRALPNLSNVTTFTGAKLRDARHWFEATFERATGVAWVPRYARDRITGGGVSAILLPRWPIRVNPTTGAPAVYSVRAYTDVATYTAYTSAELADLIVDGPTLRRFAGTPFAAGNGNLIVEYEHGYEGPSADIVEAAKVAILDKLLVENREGGRATRVYATQTQDGIVRTSTPGPDRPFGIPAVDEVAAAHDHRLPAFA